VNPDIEDGETTKTIEIFQDLVIAGGGTIIRVDKWGKRQLAYQIQKKREGYYVLMYFHAPPTLITEMNRRYKLTDTIMRHMVIQLRKDQVDDILKGKDSTELLAPVESLKKPVRTVDFDDDNLGIDDERFIARGDE